MSTPETKAYKDVIATSKEFERKCDDAFENTPKSEEKPYRVVFLPNEQSEALVWDFATEEEADEFAKKYAEEQEYVAGCSAKVD